MTHDPRQPAPTSSPRRSRRRRTGIALGLTLILAALGLGTAGVYASTLSLGGSHLDLGADGSYRTELYGLATDSTDWRDVLFGWAGSVRLQVAPDDRSPIFVGVAPPDEVSRYLEQVGHTTVIEGSGGDVVLADHDGGAPSTRPAAAIEWTDRSEGAGIRTLRWEATDGPQVVLAMSPDGAAGVGVQVVSSAVTLDRMPWWAPTGALAAAAASGATGIVVTRRAWRGRSRDGATTS